MLLKYIDKYVFKWYHEYYKTYNNYSHNSILFHKSNTPKRISSYIQYGIGTSFVSIMDRINPIDTIILLAMTKDAYLRLTKYSSIVIAARISIGSSHRIPLDRLKTQLLKKSILKYNLILSRIESRWSWIINHIHGWHNNYENNESIYKSQTNTIMTRQVRVIQSIQSQQPNIDLSIESRQ